MNADQVMPDRGFAGGRPMTKVERESEAINAAFEMDRVRASERAYADLELDIAADMEREFPSTRKDSSMAMPTRDYAGQSATATRVSPFDELISAVGSLRELQGRAAALAEQIAGSVPHDVSESKDKRGASGLVDVVEIAVENIREICAGITDDLQRIERRL